MSTAQKILFIDRDGTVLLEPPDEQIDHFNKMRFYPGVIGALKRVVACGAYKLVMVTNQDGLGTESFPEETFWPVHNLMLSILEGEGIRFDDVLIDRHFPEDNAPTRKPGTAMLTAYLNGTYDLAGSWVIGDRESDVQLARNLGCKALYLGKKETGADVTTTSWEEAARRLCAAARSARITRTTKETDIIVDVALEGQGIGDIHTGLGFFDHMLEQLARHSGMDLYIRCKGDLHVDEHHTIEDTALALGEAMRAAMGDKIGMQRYGFHLPMDEALARVAIDFSGRPWLVWQAEFNRERIGDMPTEMFYHFFKSFSDTAGCTLNMQVDGVNEHHKIEALFKAWARAIKMALKIDDYSDGIPSTKGLL
ncbi:MAG: bifunctional histidinol-phosphatase/imidazoleglycerol-phosphate dehydratase HisB [Calditrichaeota bacterium]|nr:MAG: bifunctional histidinol-phosphatase/imidazoleglycerol-phosphate dehydratase HisB [Calditrichota bacterium]